MRILIVNKFLYPNGGSETYIFKIGQQLQKMGHEVQYFGMEHENRIVGNRVESYTRNMNLKDMKLNKILYPFQIIYSSEARKKINVFMDQLCRAFWLLLNIRCTEISKPIEESIRLSVRASLCRSALRQILC